LINDPLLQVGLGRLKLEGLAGMQAYSLRMEVGEALGRGIAVHASSYPPIAQ